MKSQHYLRKLLQRYQKDKAIRSLTTRLCTLTSDTDKILELYHQAIPLIEKNLWKDSDIKNKIIEYQYLFHELESLTNSQKTTDLRYNFIIAIPVADRPQHLNTCLKSILKLCQKYNYGGFNKGTYTKIKVVVADDSQQLKNINKNKKIALKYTEKGLTVEHFGQEQQKKTLVIKNENDTFNIMGKNNDSHFYHKGASVTRNITYLKLQQLYNKNIPTLFYFIDSDQEFQVSILTAETEKNIYAINYFYYLDQLFRKKNISMLTGKVVGDPPVSPAVMAGTFLDDLNTFIRHIAKLKPEGICKFHRPNKKNNQNAAYHDMADLFGFKEKSETHEYHCSLNQPHNHNDCFNALANKLNQFFYGVHSTRKSTYVYQYVFESLSPARTLYTGNYIFKPEYLKYFIPFSDLKLRMAGPTLGRIIQAELGDKFISANLPMLHKRTVNTSGTSEFRSGVAQQDSSVDLSGEFVRQFYGDVMLFSIIQLIKIGFPKKTIPFDIIENVVYEVIESLNKKYSLKQKEIISKLDQLNILINNPEYWWNQESASNSAKLEFKAFINNIKFNFNKDATIYKTIQSEKSSKYYHQKIAYSIMDYPSNMVTWQAFLSSRVNL